MKKLITITLCAAALAVFSGCEKKDPTLGERLDAATKSAEKSAKDAKKAADKEAKELNKKLDKALSE